MSSTATPPLAGPSQAQGQVSSSAANTHVHSSLSANLEVFVGDAIARGEQNINLEQRDLQDLPPQLVQRLQEVVVRLALNNNRLSSLPREMAFLHRLRYLSIRANQFRSFPSAISELPCLEILDISRNKITRLPSNMGRLEQTLKVLSIAKNRIKRLPVYVGSMQELRVLKLDGNPLEFPGKEILQTDGFTDLDQWLQRLKAALRQAATTETATPVVTATGSSREDVLADNVPLQSSSSSSQSLQKAIQTATATPPPPRVPLPSQQSIAESAPRHGEQNRTSLEMELQREYQKRMELQQHVDLLQRRLREERTPVMTGDHVEDVNRAVELLFQQKVQAAGENGNVSSMEAESDREVAYAVVLAANQFCMCTRACLRFVGDPAMDQEFRLVLDAITGSLHTACQSLNAAKVQADTGKPPIAAPLLQQIPSLLQSLQTHGKEIIAALDMRVGKTLVMDFYVAALHLKEACELGNARLSSSPPTSVASGTMRSLNSRMRRPYRGAATPTRSSPVSSDPLPAHSRTVTQSPNRSSVLSGSSSTSGSGSISNISQLAAHHPYRTLIVASEQALAASNYLISVLQAFLQEKRTAEEQQLAPLMTATGESAQRLMTSTRSLLLQPPSSPLPSASTLASTAPNALSADSANALRRLYMDANYFLSHSTKLVTTARTSIAQLSTSKPVVAGLQNLTRAIRVLAIQLQSLVGVGAGGQSPAMMPSNHLGAPSIGGRSRTASNASSSAVSLGPSPRMTPQPLFSTQPQQQQYGMRSNSPRHADKK